MSEYEHIVRRMIEAAGHFTQSAGIGRVLGQIFAYLYFSREPRSLDDMTAALGISKGSASIGVRQLEQWGALEKVWVKGDRKDYYRAHDRFGRIIKNAIRDLAGKRMETSYAVLADTEDQMNEKLGNGDPVDEDDKFIMEQVTKIRAFQQKAQSMWDGVVLQMLLK